MPPQFRLYIVRHGETQWNRTRRIQGHIDVPLNEDGLKQAMLVAEALKDIPFVRAYSSDLQRASKTAECILQYHSDVDLQRDELIRERYMGELQGHIGSSNQRAPSMEKTPDLVARCLEWYSKFVVYVFSTVEAGDPAERPRDVLVVSHGGWISALLFVLRGSGLLTCRRGVEIGRCLNTGVSIIEYRKAWDVGDDDLVGTLVQYSGAAHLVRADMHIREGNADVLDDTGEEEEGGEIRVQ